MLLFPKTISTRSAYSLAVIVPFVALGARLLFHDPLGDQLPYMTFFTAVVIVSWMGGARPGLLATVLGALLGNLYAAHPYGRFHLEQGFGMTRPLFFLLFSGWFSLVAETVRSALHGVLRGEQRLSAIFENVTAGMCEFQIDGLRILNVNNTLCELTGYSKSELLSMTLSDLSPPSDPVPDLGFLKRMDMSRLHLHHQVKRLKRKDGEGIWTQFTAGILRMPEGLRGIAMIIDVTESKGMEQQLQESDRRYRLLAEAFHAMNWVMNPDGALVSATRRWEEYHGLRAEECGRAGIKSLVHPMDQLYFDSVMSSMLERGTPFELECRMRHGADDWRWCHSRLVPVADARGRVHQWVGSTTDIHEKRVAEDRLRGSQARFHSLCDASPMGIFQANARGVVTYANARLLEIWDMTEAEFLELGWLNRVHPEDRDALMEGIGRADVEKRPHQVEYRLLMTNQKVRWVHQSTAIIRDAGGGHAGVAGTIEDITSRRATGDAAGLKSVPA